MKLAGKRALITGGNSGVGLATAHLFISEGGRGSDKDSDLEARGARQCNGRGIRKSFRPLLFHGSTCPLGRAGRSGQ